VRQPAQQDSDGLGVERDPPDPGVLAQHRFTVAARLDREPNASIEYLSRRCHLLAQR
jgi:hypothetical protein